MIDNVLTRNNKLSELMPWIDKWIIETDSLIEFSDIECKIFNMIRDNWNTKDRFNLLDELYDKYAEDVKKVIGKFLRHKTVKDWKAIAEDKTDNSLKSFISTLWAPVDNNSFKFSITEKNNTYQIECTKCPMADLVSEIGGEKWIFELACMSDYYMVEGFNKNINLKRDKTLITGDKCCNHFYN